MINLGKFTEEKFNQLKGQVSGGVKNLGKFSEQAFQGIKNHLASQPAGLALQGKIKESGQKLASNYMNFGKSLAEGRSVDQMIGDATNFTGAGTVKQIDNLTKNEMIKAIDYLRGGKGFNQIAEENITKLAEKFGGNLKWGKGNMANFLENLIDKTKTKDVSGRKVL